MGTNYALIISAFAVSHDLIRQSSCMVGAGHRSRWVAVALFRMLLRLEPVSVCNSCRGIVIFASRVLLIRDLFAPWDYHTLTRRAVFLLADGMGGHAGEASQLHCTQVIQAYFVEHWNSVKPNSALLEGAFFQANQAIVQRQQQHRNALRWVQRLWR